MKAHFDTRPPAHGPASCRERRGRYRGRCVAAVLLAVVVSGCASAPVDEAEFVRVETQIAEAQEMQAETHAAAELFDAQEKLERARKANTEGDSDDALRLLREAELHAQLAEARSLTSLQEESLAQINAGLETLRRELHTQGN